ncbi:MAG: hypothetical protein HW387_427 [Parachlamydiales bacterium]|nr:hypothetical protein [Parachlamydiales bacterium]
MENKAAAFGRAHQSPLTRFVHLFDGEPRLDAIPVYENFCFALALMRLKTMEGVQEGKQLFERLFPFQAGSQYLWAGHFPLYLHDYPRCYSPVQSLRIAPVLQILLKHFSHVLDAAFKERACAVLQALIASAKSRRNEKPFEPLWERRYQAILGQAMPMAGAQTSAEWGEELITNQLLGLSSHEILRLVHPNLGVYVGPGFQEGQPQGSLLEACVSHTAPSACMPLLELALLDPPITSWPCWSGHVNGWRICQRPEDALGFAEQLLPGSERMALRYFWKGKNQLHSLMIPTGKCGVAIEEKENGVQVLFDLQESNPEDLFETMVFCDISDETQILVNQKKATLFLPGDEVSIHTPDRIIRLTFAIHEGSGDFCGHISRSNRPVQRKDDGYEAFDWRIALRTLRRSQFLLLSLNVSFSLIK